MDELYIYPCFIWNTIVLSYNNNNNNNEHGLFDFDTHTSTILKKTKTKEPNKTEHNRKSILWLSNPHFIPISVENPIFTFYFKLLNVWTLL